MDSKSTPSQFTTLSMTDSNRPSIVIIGAGVIGLTSALSLQSAFKKTCQFVLVARDFPHEESINYASMWAGAHVRPIPGDSKQLTEEGEWLQYTSNILKKQAVAEAWAGVTALEGIEYMAAPSEDYTLSKGNYAATPGFRQLRDEELPEGVVLGVRYETFCINSPVYCASLLRKFRLNGGRVVRRSLAAEKEAFAVAKDVRCVINASGTGFGDPLLFPTRGQTCLVANPCPSTITKQNADGTWTFIIPRGFDGGTIIGGTKEPHNWDAEPSPETREKLLKAAAEMYPPILNESGGFDVIADVVGRRPTRHGGMRLEVETSQNGADTGAIIHAYGAGGRGFEISWGVAQRVVQLVQQHMETPFEAKL